MVTTNILDNIDPRQLGERLQQARKRSGITQADAAEAISAARTTMVAIEKGERRVKHSELVKLARAYGQPVSDLIKQPSIIESFEVQFRAGYKRSPEEEEQIQPCILRFEKLCRNYLELEEIVGSPLPHNYPREYQVAKMPIEATAETIAIEERKRLGLGDGPIHGIRAILEQGVGLRIFYIKMPSKYSEMYSYDDQLGGCLAINAEHYEERQRWSIAHGYLHFLAHRHKSVVDFDGQYQRVPESERLAEAFPKYFLMPTSSLLKQFNDTCNDQGTFTPTNLFTLAHYYGVSVEALTRRLEGMKLLSSGTWERLKNRGLKVKEVQKELGLKETSQGVGTLPIHYQHLAIEALEKGLITEGRFADLLNVNRLEARRLADSLREQPNGTTEDSQLDLRKA
ncbi:helix-turn-helix domain-containing protein [Phormidium tenue]|uniref:Transcriptional regulator n=1 Tax=Phormidium tenue NIES-30 TaxID=549789 RepID=A0A1U7J671_9CYAN|nr:XRE family transcriptional regulator [Phormidium tenue]MBD2232099.1 ImmA/IrrE family metallo-endopeptidase [Phormidium tenue FACHB-1052]OKH48314.1 transcriptional regulator [Phormidium tenue NIES-30]